jgi:hypothetical protein
MHCWKRSPGNSALGNMEQLQLHIDALSLSLGDSLSMIPASA